MPGTADTISGLMAGPANRWSPTPGPMTITYAFRTTQPTDALGPIQPLPDFVKADIRAALAEISSFAGVTFVEVPESDAVLIQYGGYSRSNATAQAGYPGVGADGKPRGIAGEVNFAPALYQNIADADDYRKTLLHETLHALGLKHPHDGAVAEQLPLDQDRLEFTVMSYARATFVPSWENGSRAVKGILPAHAGVFDIAAMQFLYGAAAKPLATGDDVYVFDAVPIQRIVVDGGGIDTIDASAAALRSVIDLRDNSSSSIGIYTADDWRALLAPAGSSAATIAAVNARLNGPDPIYTGLNNLAIGQGSMIENAIGGAGNDEIRGNALNNELTGNRGNDLLDGQGGFDTALFAGARAGYAVARQADGSWTVAGADGSDVLRSVEALRFSDRTVYALTGDNATIARLYAAAFGRAPDPGGLAVQTGAHDAGLSLAALSGNFIGSAEFVTRYGTSTSNAAFAGALYGNVLGRTPDADGLAVQVRALDGGLSRANLLLNFADSAENQARAAGDWLLV